MDQAICPEVEKEEIKVEEEDAPSFISADSSLDPLYQTLEMEKERGIPGEIKIDQFMHEVKEENEIKIEEEAVLPSVFTDDPLACQQEPSWKEGKSEAREIPGEIKIDQFIHEVKEENEIKVEEEEVPPSVFTDDPLASCQQEPSQKEGKSEARAKEKLAAKKPEAMKIIGFGDSKTQEGITVKLIKVDTSKSSRVFMLVPVQRSDGPNGNGKYAISVPTAKISSSTPNVHSGASQKENQKEDASKSVAQDTIRKQALTHKTHITTKRDIDAASTSTGKAEPKLKRCRTESHTDDYFDKLMTLEMKQHELRMKILRQKEKLLTMEMETHKKMIEASAIKTEAVSAMQAVSPLFHSLMTLSTLLCDNNVF